MLSVKPEAGAAKESTTMELSAPKGITKLEAEVICMFVQLSRALGQPRSYAEIYGFIFISARPVTLEEIITRLGISRGSGSMGLKFLRDLGAIKIVYIPGDRSIHYEAVAQLRLLVTRFLQTQVFPHFDSSRERLDAISEMVKELPSTERAHVCRRIDTLRTWADRTERLLPLLMKILEP
jgi:DNA-binding transcriptional regulator GbsR (MarR family)